MVADDAIGVEDLETENLVRRGRGRRRAGLNRCIADAGRGQLLAVSAWQARETGGEVVVLPARDTTQFRCHACGLVEDRDRDAARSRHPRRSGPGDGADPSGADPVGVDGDEGIDGDETEVPEGTGAV